MRDWINQDKQKNNRGCGLFWQAKAETNGPGSQENLAGTIYFSL